MQRYRRLFAIRGVPSTVLLMVLARVPSAGAGMALTLHVAVGMGRGYAAAGTVGAAATVGIALGGPMMGRVVDKYGLRRMLVITTIGEAAFWFSAPAMPYVLLLVSGFACGIVAMPAMSIGRQTMTALVPEADRRTALSLDSIGVELTFMMGPALAVLVCTQFSTVTALYAVGGATTASGLALYLINPPMRADHEREEQSPPRRSWLTPRFAAVLLGAVGVVFVLAGHEVALVAALRGNDQLDWTGIVIIAMCLASALGGVVYGSLRRSVGLLPLLVLLAALTVPIGVFGSQWWVLALMLAPANFACAPAITSTGEQVSRLAPAGARGEAMGLQGSAFTLGAAIGSPLIGLVVDHAPAGWGFAVAGLGGLVLAALAFGLSRFGSRPRSRPPLAPRPGDALAEPAPSG
ncbi:MFS transporter [Labedaea rhizosphaerae]|uniref:Putative MFS family arabinose efflux permease n=1 Tax=Labedaea rhizosphaerae TaxID=598644 RepID=A0A4V3D089_LABRH|nr:MFS transporter [Labedaea rhizosphaerae]TDQ04835.1 putative MFS family arabinose efflux permease [Labedaea rhizosphaerae]